MQVKVHCCSAPELALTPQPDVHPRSRLKADPNLIAIFDQQSFEHKDQEPKLRKYSTQFLKPQFLDSAVPAKSDY